MAGWNPDTIDISTALWLYDDIMQYLKTTLTIPEHLMQQVKLYALSERKTVSELMREALAQRLAHQDTHKTEPTHRLGVLRLGTTNIYKKRVDLYANHIQRKMGV